MSLPVKKIYVDSRYKTNDSVSTSNFKFQLPRNVFLPQNTVFYLEDVCIPHSWHTIEAGLNDAIYLYYQTPDAAAPPIVSVAIIPPNNYIGSALASKVQELLYKQDKTFTVSYDSNNHCITISLYTVGAKFQLLADDALTAYASVLPLINVNPNSPNSWNDIIGNSTASSTLYSAGNPYTSGMLDLLSIRNIFISSPNLGSFSTMGARGESNIIKKVPVSSDFGYLIVDSFTSPHDFLDCSKLTLGTIEFSLRDVKGNYIPLHGGHVSFSIVFSAVNTDT